MKKYLAISMIVAATFAGAGVASADDVTLGGYSGWQLAAFAAGTAR